MEIYELTHPTYSSNVSKWLKWRLTYSGGDDFIEAYVKQFSTLENVTDFANRKEITYIPAFAKAAVNDVKNAIFQRTTDITREEISATYKQSITGELRGVDNEGSSMNAFIGRKVLPELLSMSKVGVFVDMPIVEGNTLAQTNQTHPYMYIYKAESILNWKYDVDNQLELLLLENTSHAFDELTGLPTEEITTYSLFTRTESGIEVVISDEDGVMLTSDTILIPEIPFVIVEISDSLLKDIANHQVALVNLASSDMNYALKSNFPFYTEQYDPRSEFSKFIRKDTSGEGTLSGTDEIAKASAAHEVTVGATTGRRYALNTDRPGFISPSSEPILASMKKSDEIKSEIRQLLALAISNLKPTMASAESKGLDQQGLEAGLSYIGLELETAERRIAHIWGLYENEDINPSIKYPSKYSLESDTEKRKEANELEKLAHSVPSNLYKKTLIKEIVNITVGTKISDEKLQQIYAEIDASQVTSTNPDVIAKDVEVGLVDLETASLARGYPKGSVEKAKDEHAERLARIKAAQTDMTNAGARGDKDSDTNDSANLEKKDSQNNIDKDLKSKTRGKDNKTTNKD